MNGFYNLSVNIILTNPVFLHLIVILSRLMLVGRTLAALDETFFYGSSLSRAENFREYLG